MDKDLFEHISNKLHNHEELYAQGAWERFSNQEKKKRRFVLWPLWSAAAVILICSIGYILLNQTVKQNLSTPKFTGKKTQKTDSAKIPSEKFPIPNVIKEENTPFVLRKKPVESNPTNNDQQIESTKSSAIDLPDLTADQTGILTYNSSNILFNSMVKINIAPQSISKYYTLNKPTAEKSPTIVLKHRPTFEDILEADSRPQQLAKQTKTAAESKWMPSVYVAPAVGNDSKVNMNYGFSISYALGKKVSLSSGVAYTALSSTEALNFSAATAYSATNLESISTKVSGINIPLELRYNINDKLYTGIGVSALAVLDNRQQNNYVVSQFADAMLSSAGNGTPQAFLVQSRVVETQTDSNLDPNRYVGFYNFSLGYKQKISNKNNIAIEPFLRLPMKTFTRDNLNLTNGGLRIKFDF
ncbi:hypothetical protein ACJVDH_12455 [Pedobacter sp. AW1-32]|uniref:hypothetical protein n=1 Tax=Pedobacter sp. AW1-32 TaxID=3383026 RepID=UPI003FEDF459